jgi:hypothetical protein
MAKRFDVFEVVQHPSGRWIERRVGCAAENPDGSISVVCGKLIAECRIREVVDEDATERPAEHHGNPTRYEIPALPWCAP